MSEQQPIPMFLTCPMCSARHIDEGEFATKPHHTHACQGCGLTWRPAIVPTVGVRFLPGFKNGDPSPHKQYLCSGCGRTSELVECDLQSTRHTGCHGYWQRLP